MSWPGEQDQTPPQAEGGGRRRRRDSPPEDPYLAAQNPGGSGRRGSGEFTRPAEYVQYAQEQAAEYDRNVGYGEQAGYGQQAGYEPASGYGQQYGYSYEPPSATQYEPAQYQPTQYEPTRGYAEPAYFRPEADPYAAPQQSPSFQDEPGQGPASLNSSGFYPLAQRAAAPPPEPPRQPYAEPSRFVTRPRTGDADDAPAGAGTTASTTATAAATAATAAPDPDSDVSDWLHFVESRADLRAERTRKLRFRLILLGVVLALVAAGGGLLSFLRGDDSMRRCSSARARSSARRSRASPINPSVAFSSR